MIINEFTSILATIVAAYLVGSVPFAYIFTRLATGKDIRQLGSGSGGAHNVFREVGLKIAIPVAFFDVSKGAVAVLITTVILGVSVYEPNILVLTAALAAIAGHMWSVYLKFRGGNGLSVTIGVLAILVPWELLIAGCLLLIFIIFTRNLVLSTNLGLLSVPASAWFVDKSWLLFGFSTAVAIMLIIHFIPTAKAALFKAGSKESLANELLRKG